MKCSMWDCENPATHALLVWEETGKRIEAYPRCQGCGDAQIAANMVQRVTPNAKAKLVSLDLAER